MKNGRIIPGSRFGRLLVLSLAETDKWRNSKWLCQCDCGNVKIVRAGNLSGGQTKSCGCLARETTSRRSLKNLEEIRFGRWLVLRRAENRHNNSQVMWTCRCDCGTEKDVYATLLSRGMSKSCGCHQAEMMRQREYSAEELRRRSEAQKGAKCNFWKGGITPLNVQIRMSKEYANWRTAVFMRDNYTCQECGARSGDHHAHHIKSFSEFPELRLEISNGQTLCVPCHKETPSYLKSNKP